MIAPDFHSDFKCFYTHQLYEVLSEDVYTATTAFC